MMIKSEMKTMIQVPTSVCPTTRRHTESMRKPTEKLIVATLNNIKHAAGGHRGSVYTAVICSNSAESRVNVKNRKATDNRV